MPARPHVAGLAQGYIHYNAVIREKHTGWARTGYAFCQLIRDTIVPTRHWPPLSVIESCCCRSTNNISIRIIIIMDHKNYNTR